MVNIVQNPILNHIEIDKTQCESNICLRTYTLNYLGLQVLWTLSISYSEHSAMFQKVQLLISSSEKAEREAGVYWDKLFLIYTSECGICLPTSTCRYKPSFSNLVFYFEFQTMEKVKRTWNSTCNILLWNPLELTLDHASKNKFWN